MDDEDARIQRNALDRRIVRLEERILEFNRTIDTYQEMVNLLKDALRETRKQEQELIELGGRYRAAKGI